jgi:hypothetical protein
MCMATVSTNISNLDYYWSFLEFKLDVVMMHINSVGFIAIARLKNIHNSLVS